MTTSKHRVLVVDDDHSCRLLMSTLMARAGYETDAVADGSMALAMIQAQRPDVVLLDAHLPGIDGWEVCRSIKDSDVGTCVAVVLVSAFDTLEARQRAFGVGADAFLTKPFKSEGLMKIVHTLIHRDSGDNAVDDESTPLNALAAGEDP